jgi:hypothetical protein
MDGEPVTAARVEQRYATRSLNSRRGDPARARGERPLYRVSAAPDGSWRVEWTPWVTLVATGRRAALEEARAAIAEWLDVPPIAFDVEILTS